MIRDQMDNMMRLLKVVISMMEFFNTDNKFIIVNLIFSLSVNHFS